MGIIYEHGSLVVFKKEYGWSHMILHSITEVTLVAGQAASKPGVPQPHLQSPLSYGARFAPSTAHHPNGSVQMFFQDVATGIPPVMDHPRLVINPHQSASIWVYSQIDPSRISIIR
jgi:hypothetical protein